MFHQRRSDPSIKSSSSYPSSMNIRSEMGSLAFPAEFSSYKTCKASAAADDEYGDSDYGDGDRKTQLAETELDTRMESLCLSVTEHALGLDK